MNYNHREKEAAYLFLDDCTKLQIRELIDNQYENTEVFMECLRSVLANRDYLKGLINKDV